MIFCSYFFLQNISLNKSNCAFHRLSYLTFSTNFLRDTTLQEDATTMEVVETRRLWKADSFTTQSMSTIKQTVMESGIIRREPTKLKMRPKGLKSISFQIQYKVRRCKVSPAGRGHPYTRLCCTKLKISGSIGAFYPCGELSSATYDVNGREVRIFLKRKTKDRTKGSKMGGNQNTKYGRGQKTYSLFVQNCI